MNIKHISILSIMSLLLISCGSTMPGFAKKPPNKKGYIYAVGVGSNKFEAEAIMEAQTVARTQISNELGMKNQSKVKRVTDTVNSSDAVKGFKTLIDEYASNSMSGVKTIERDVKKKGEIYKAYVLMELNEADAQKRFLDRIKSQKDVNDALRVAGLYTEWESEFGSNK